MQNFNLGKSGPLNTSASRWIRLQRMRFCFVRSFPLHLYFHWRHRVSDMHWMLHWAWSVVWETDVRHHHLYRIRQCAYDEPLSSCFYWLQFFVSCCDTAREERNDCLSAGNLNKMHIFFGWAKFLSFLRSLVLFCCMVVLHIWMISTLCWKCLRVCLCFCLLFLYLCTSVLLIFDTAWLCVSAISFASCFFFVVDTCITEFFLHNISTWRCQRQAVHGCAWAVAITELNEKWTPFSKRKKICIFENGGMLTQTSGGACRHFFLLWTSYITIFWFFERQILQKQKDCRITEYFNLQKRVSQCVNSPKMTTLAISSPQDIFESERLRSDATKTADRVV